MPATTQSIADRLSAPLERARQRYARSPAQQFLRWWGGELAGLMPASWRALFAAGQARVLYVAAADALELRLEEAGRDRLLTRIPSGSDAELSSRVDAALGPNRVERPRWLLLPGGQVLRRRITLPAAATERLREVVAHELDRQTPFRADQVTYDCHVVSVDANSKMAQVELLVLTRDRLEAALAPLGALANRLSGVDALDAEGQPLHCNLLPPERRQLPDRRMLWMHLGLAAIGLIALLLALTTMLDNRRAALTQLETEVAARQAQKRAVDVLAKQLEQAAEGANFLARTRAEKPPMLAVLADISARIPNNTSLERFSEQEGQIYLTGLSMGATGLVAKLQPSKLLREPALSGSVQPDSAVTGRDRFTLVAALATPAAAAAARNGSPDNGAAHAPAQR